MDFSWVKQLADQSNQTETDRQERIRRGKEDKKTMAQGTCPFVEKIFVLVSKCVEEFNKHIIFPHMKITIGKLVKRSKTPDAPTAEPDEVAYFAFARCGYMYGIRGVNGVVEFIEFPVSEDSSALTMKLEDLGASASKSFQAQLGEERRVVWAYQGQVMDGATIISICQNYFSEFVERTTEAAGQETE